MREHDARLDREVEDERDYDMDDWMAMSDAEVDARFAEASRELLEAYDTRQRALAQMSRLDRYRLERREALYQLLLWHMRSERLRVLGIDFIDRNHQAIIKRRQSELLDLRRYLRTGVVPHRGEKQ